MYSIATTISAISILSSTTQVAKSLVHCGNASSEIPKADANAVLSSTVLEEWLHSDTIANNIESLKNEITFWLLLAANSN